MACSNGYEKLPNIPNTHLLRVKDYICGRYGEDSYTCKLIKQQAGNWLPLAFIPDVGAFCAAGPPLPVTSIDISDFTSPTAPFSKAVQIAKTQEFPTLCQCIPPDIPTELGQCDTEYTVRGLIRRFREDGTPNSSLVFNHGGGTTNKLYGPLTFDIRTTDQNGNVVVSTGGFDANGNPKQISRPTATPPAQVGATIIEEVTRLDGLPDDCGEPGEEIEPPPEPPPEPPDLPPADGIPEPDVGPPGEQGAPGEQGEQGLTGEQGPKGDKGDKGDQGEKGDKGDQGDQGEPGEPGPKGDQGEQGERGVPGAQGTQGPKGDKGDEGEKGDCPEIASGELIISQGEEPSISIIQTGECSYNMSLVIPGLETEPEELLLFANYTVTTEPDFATFKVTDIGKYYIPRCGSIRWTGPGGVEPTESVSLHGESGAIPNPNPLVYNDFEIDKYTGFEIDTVKTTANFEVPSKVYFGSRGE